METTLPPFVFDSRRDFIEIYKKELIGIGVLTVLVFVILGYMYFFRQQAPMPPQVKRQQAPMPPQVKAPMPPQVKAPMPPQVKAPMPPQAKAPMPTQVKAQPIPLSAPLVVKRQQAFSAIQQRLPRLTKVKKQMTICNLPPMTNPVPTGFSNQYRPT